MTTPKPIRDPAHAPTAMRERELEVNWIEWTVYEPDWVQPDPAHTGVERRFKTVAEREGRVLRVAVVETSEEIRIVTAFLDRRARKPK
jgi:uncharacterized DUF497 family protein